MPEPVYTKAMASDQLDDPFPQDPSTRLFVVTTDKRSIVVDGKSVAVICEACRQEGGVPVVRPATEEETIQAMEVLRVGMDEFRRILEETARYGIQA